MASALIEGLLLDGWSREQVTVLEPNEERCSHISTTLGVRTLTTPSEILSEVGVVVWAVKPQVLQSAIEPVRPMLGSPLHVSICAGISSATLSRWLLSERVIRAMPNMPALVGAGVTGMFAKTEVSPPDLRLAEMLFSTTGYAFWVDTDDRIDAVTAISGSGPGYIFEFLSAFQSAAQMLGFPEEQARLLAVRTALGALTQASNDTTPLATLRDRVTSKGGTTEAGLEAFSKYHLPTAMKLAVANAYQRAQELSKELDM